MKLPNQCTYRKLRARSATEVNERDLTRLLHGVDNDRDLAIISLLATSGLRSEELAQLHRNSISVVTERTHDGTSVTYGTGTFSSGMSTRERRFYCDKDTVDAITAYLRDREDQNDSLFANYWGVQLSSVQIKRIFYLWRKTLNLHHIRICDLRRTLVRKPFRADISAELVATNLGHSGVGVLNRHVLSTKAELVVH